MTALPLIANGLAPGLALFIIALIAGIILLLLAAFILAIALAAAILFLTIAGVVSASVITGIARRSVSAGVRTFFIGCATAAGIPAGMISLLVVAHWTHWDIGFSRFAPLACACGAAAGFVVAYLFNRVWSRVVAEVLTRTGRGAAQPRADNGFVVADSNG